MHRSFDKPEERDMVAHVRQALINEIAAQGRILDTERLAKAAIGAVIDWALDHPLEVQ